MFKSFLGRHTSFYVFTGWAISLIPVYIFGPIMLFQIILIGLVTCIVGYVLGLIDGSATGKNLLLEDIDESDESYRDYIFSKSNWYKELKSNSTSVKP